MVDDIVFNKVAIIERCLRRIQEEYHFHFHSHSHSHSHTKYLHKIHLNTPTYVALN